MGDMAALRIDKKRLVAFFAMIVLMAVVFPAGAQAKTLNLKTIGSSDSLSTQVKKSAKVTKRGTYTVKMKNGNGIICFKAPKTKTYTFTFSGLKSGKTSSLVCVTGFCSAKLPSTVSWKNIKTKEGKRPRVPLMSASLANNKSVVFDGYSYLRLAKRTAKLKIKKGKKIYLVMQAKDMNDDYVASNLRLKIS